MEKSQVDRVYSSVVVKSVDEDKRIIRGIASTPGTDRSGDIVEPKGAVFSLPVPFLWQHKHDQPIGNVTKAKITDAGIEVEVQLVAPTPDMPAGLVARLQEAWSSIKTGLVRGMSIGFNPIEYAFLDSGGVHFLKWGWHELSAVTVPANAEASIQQIKSLDTQQRAASGKSVPVVSVGKSSPGVAGTKSLSITTGDTQVKTFAEQIAAFEETLKAKQAEMVGIMHKSAEAGTTLDAEESTQYDTLRDECAALEKHIERVKSLQEQQAKSAKPVSEDSRVKGFAGSSVALPVQVKNTQKLEPGIAFARAAKALALGHLEHRNAIDIAKNLYGDNESIVRATEMLVTKAAVPAATTTNPTYAAPLIGNEPLADFVEYLRPQTILGRMPGLRNIGFRLPIVGQTSGGAGYWVGEGGAKPLTKFDFNKTQLDPLKVANIAVASMEVIRDSRPAADVILRDQLAAALRERLDIDFIDPNKAAVAGVSPASVLNGVAGIPSSGTDAEAVRADIQALYRAFIAANNAPTDGVWVMDAVTALALGMMQNPLGQAEFPGVGMTGGTFQTLPVVVSQYVPRNSTGGVVALINASDIYIGDEGGIDLSMSTEASLQMTDTPDNVPTATTVTVNLWQHNLVGFRAERAINWSRRRASAVAYLTGVNWGA